MRGPARGAFVFLFTLLLLAGVASAQDPAKVAPGVYKCSFENEKVRLCEVKIKAGETVSLHSHPDHLVYITAPGKLRITPQKGDPVEIDFALGQTVWVPADTHTGTNIGKTELRGILIEMKPSPDPVRSALMQIQHDWAKAMTTGDLSIIEGAIASDWTLVAPDGSVANWPAMKADLQSGALKFTSVTPSDLEVRVFGDTAIVTGRSADQATYKGMDISGNFRFTDVFMNRGGRWQAVSTHVTKIGM